MLMWFGQMNRPGGNLQSTEPLNESNNLIYNDVNNIARNVIFLNAKCYDGKEYATLTVQILKITPTHHPKYKTPNAPGF